MRWKICAFFLADIWSLDSFLLKTEFISSALLVTEQMPNQAIHGIVSEVEED